LVSASLGTYAFIIDFGVLHSTGESRLERNWSCSWIEGEKPFIDCSGYCTHLACTIGAFANEIGVLGVAAGAEILSPKVFDRDGDVVRNSTVIDPITMPPRLSMATC